MPSGRRETIGTPNGLRTGKGTGTGPKAFGPAERTGGTPDLRIQDRPGRKRCLRASALPPVRKGLRFRRGRAGPGFGLGAANPVWTQGFGSWPCQGGTKASAEDPAGRECGVSALEERKAGKRDASSESAERRTVRASALSGSQRGNRKSGFGRFEDPGGSGAADPRSNAPPTRNRPARDASPPRPGSSYGTVGAGGNAGPH